MLTIHAAQIDALEADAQSRFIGRLDHYLGTQLGARWAARPRQARRAQVEAGVERGLALGIEEEAYVAQFALIHLLRGEAFLREPTSRRIVDDPSMTWRQKLFQLSALAGIDLAQGAARHA